MMRKGVGKNKIIFVLFLVLVFMGAGYAALDQKLNITGSSRPSGSFSVVISDVDETSDSILNGNVVTKTESHTDTTATFTTSFVAPGDYVEYEVEIENQGTIDSAVKIEYDGSENLKDSANHPLLLFTMIEKTSDKDLKNIMFPLNAGDSEIAVIKVQYNPDAVGTTSEEITFRITITATQEALTDYTPGYFNPEQGGESSEEDYYLDSNGKIIGYNNNGLNYNEDGYLVIPATNYEGKPIKYIDEDSFAQKYNNVGVYVDSSYEIAAVVIDYDEGTSEYQTVLNTVLYLLGGEEEEEQGVNNRMFNISPENLFTSKKEYGVRKVVQYFGDIPFYSKTLPDQISYAGELHAFIDPTTGELIEFKVEKLDLSGAINLIEIGESSFEDKGLTSVIFPINGVLTTIEDYAFDDNQISGTLTIPSSVTSIGEKAFNRNQIAALSFESGSHLQVIGDRAFRNNSLSGTLTIPSSVESIGTEAFEQNQITTLLFQNSSHLQTIGSYAFCDNQIENTLTIPSSVESIGDSAFYGVSDGSTNQITSLVFESGSHLQTIGNSAFYSNKLSGTLTIPASVTSIGSGAFEGSSGGSTNQITSLVFASGSQLETIGDSAFQNNAITGILTIPSSVTSIGDYAFQGEYNGSTNQITALTFESGSQLETIGDNAFQQNAITGTLTIPSGVTSIGNYAFQYNAITGTLTIPSSVTSIGESAFTGSYDGSTNQITALTFASGSQLETIGGNAFQYNAITGTLTIPSSVTSIGNDAFEGSFDGSTNQITSLVFESGSHLQTIREFAFQYNAITGTLTIPSSVTSIGGWAFSSNQIEELHLGSAITNIESHAFFMENSTDLKDVYIDMTESNWNNSVSKGNDIFNGTPTMHYNT